MDGLGSTIVRAGQRLKQARKDFGHAHEPRQKLLSTLLACAAAVIVVALLMVRWGDASAIDYIELPSRDLRVNALETDEETDTDILIITIDEAALAYGDAPLNESGTEAFAWPWPRHVHNKLIRYCRDGGARVIAFDLTFKESGPNTNQVVFQREVNGRLTNIWTLEKASDDLFALEATARDDIALALVLGGAERDEGVRDELLPSYAGEISGTEADSVRREIESRFTMFRSSDAPIPQLLDGWPSVAAAGRDGDERAQRILKSFRQKVNSDELMLGSSRYRSLLPLTEPDEQQGVGGVGLVMGFKDMDGVTRRFDVIGTYDSEVYRSLPLEVWRLYVLSHAREARDDPSLREDFSRRFGGMEVTDNGLRWNGDIWSFGNKLKDVPAVFESGKALYLGRDLPLDETGRVELRYHGFLSVEQNADWRFLTGAQREAVRARNPNGELFAIYPRISAKNILEDWDSISENRRVAAEIERLRRLAGDIETRLEDVPSDERAVLQEQLAETSRDLDAVRALPKHSLGLGAPDELVKDKIVIVSSTASVLVDRHQIPHSSNAPGTWVLATYIDNLKNNDFMTSPPRWAEWFTAILATVLAVFAVMYAGRLRNGLVLVLALGLVTVLASWMAFEQQVWVATAAPLAGLLFGFSHGALAKALSEGRQRRQRESFARQYMGKELVDFVINNPGSLKLGGENKEMSIFFSDVAGFTTVTETLGANNPERLVELLNVYLERMTDLMLETGGVIDKYIGDAIMCFWGAPMSMDDHAVRACRGALTCRAELRRMQPLFADAVREIAPQLIKPGGTVLHARAGINSGIVTVGNMGSSKRFAYTVMGDAVNLAARLEPQNKEYGTDLMIGQKTEELIRGEFTTRSLDLMIVKGKTEPVEVFELMGDKEVPQFITDLLGHWSKGIELFRNRQFEEALKHFKNAAHHEQVQEEDELNPSRLYIQRCKDMIATPPPPEWNGVYVKTTK